MNMPPPGGGGGDDGYTYTVAFRKHLIAARLQEKYETDVGAWAGALRGIQGLHEPGRLTKAIVERLASGTVTAKGKA